MNEQNEIKFVPLWKVEEKQIIELMNNKMVGKLLPLLDGTFTAQNCQDFVKAKKQLWEVYGYGPWAFYIHDKFAGWGGLQPEQGDADFALVHILTFGAGEERYLTKQKRGHLMKCTSTLSQSCSRQTVKILRLSLV